MPNNADIIESLLFASDKPVPLKKLAQIVGVEPDEVQEELQVLKEAKARVGAIQVVEVAGGWQLLTKADFGPFIKQLREVPRQRLSRAAFEVLAIVAYRQPATRAEVESLRGVDCAGPLQFLLEKRLIHVAGRKEAPGRPWLYATTAQFLNHFGLRSLDDLPSLAELEELNEGHALTRELFKRGAMTAPEAAPESDGNAASGDAAADDAASGDVAPETTAAENATLATDDAA